MLGMISIFFKIYGPGCDLSWRRFREHLRKRWNSLFWGEMSYRYQLGLACLLCHLKFAFFVNFLFSWSVHRCEWGIKVSHYYCVIVNFPIHQFSSVAQSCPTLCDPMNHNMPGLPVHHQLPEFTQTHVHQVRDAIQPSHPLSSPSLPAFNLAQHQGLFWWVISSHLVAKVLEFQLQH